MAHDRRIDDQDLTDADRLILGLYDRTREAIEWDESDEAILTLAREGHATAALEADGTADQDDEETDDNVVQFGPRKPSFVSRMIHSPATGFAMAASLVIGVFVGQGINPYVDLGVAPGYQDGASEDTLARRGAPRTKPLTRGIEVNPAKPGGSATVVPRAETLDAIAQTLGGYECANLSATVTAQKQVVIGGFVSSAADLQRLGGQLAGLQRQADIVNRARVLGWPFCQALEVITRSGGVQAAPERLPVVRPHNHGAAYVEKQRLVIEASATTAYRGFIYVDLIQHNGDVVHVVWSADRLGKEAAPGQQFLLGASGQTFTIVPPFGTEMLMVVSSPVRLFDEARPQVENAQKYLAELDSALGKVGSADPARQVVSNYHFIKTGPAQ